MVNPFVIFYEKYWMPSCNTCLIKNQTHLYPCIFTWFTFLGHCQSWPGSYQQIREFFSYQNDQNETSELPYFRYHQSTHSTFFILKLTPKLKQEQQPQCSTCQTPCTIKHVLLECKVFNGTRKRYFHANTMKDLFENVHMDNVLSFLKETGLYQKI